MARRLGLGGAVCNCLGPIFTRWDGKGLPKGTGRHDTPLPVRLWHLADVAEVHHHGDGLEAAVEVA